MDLDLVGFVRAAAQEAAQMAVGIVVVFLFRPIADNPATTTATWHHLITTDSTAQLRINILAVRVTAGNRLVQHQPEYF